MNQLGLLGVEYIQSNADEDIDTGHYQDQLFFDATGKTTPLLSAAATSSSLVDIAHPCQSSSPMSLPVFLRER